MAHPGSRLKVSLGQHLRVLLKGRQTALPDLKETFSRTFGLSRFRSKTCAGDTNANRDVRSSEAHACRRRLVQLCWGHGNQPPRLRPIPSVPYQLQALLCVAGTVDRQPGAGQALRLIGCEMLEGG